MTRLLIIALLLTTACAQRPTLFGKPRPEVAWKSTLAQSQESASNGRYDTADSVLLAFIARQPNTEPAAEALYWRAIFLLDPANQHGSLDSGIAVLDSYLASNSSLSRLNEVAVLKRLSRDAKQLARVEAALQTARSNVAEARRDTAEARPRSEDAAREIQRLRDELTRARAELERIRKRLAAPKP